MTFTIAQQGVGALHASSKVMLGLEETFRRKMGGDGSGRRPGQTFKKRAKAEIANAKAKEAGAKKKEDAAIEARRANQSRKAAPWARHELAKLGSGTSSKRGTK